MGRPDPDVGRRRYHGLRDLGFVSLREHGDTREMVRWKGGCKVTVFAGYSERMDVYIQRPEKELFHAACDRVEDVKRITIHLGV